MATQLVAADEPWAVNIVALASLGSVDTALPILVAPENVDDYRGQRAYGGAG